MAGGRNNSEHGGILDRTCKWLRHHRFHTSVAPEVPSSRIFKERQRIEESRTVRKNISLLQDNILRIFTDSLYCDFNIIYGYNVIRTNQCIVRTRTPHFYDVLKPYFVYTNKVINCILDTPGLYHQIEGFTRLLYSNLDLSQEEQLLVDIILNIRHASTLVNNSNTAETSIGEREYKTCVLSSCNIRDLEPVKEYAELDVSPASSEMADSGLETGSVSPHENTTSESSSTDFGELQTGEYASANEDLDKIHVKQVYDKDKSDKTTVGAEHDLLSNISGRIKDLVDSALVECMSTDHSATCSSVEAEQQQLDLSSSSTEYHEKQKLHPDEIFQYENRVLSEPFYESDCGSDENESFEFINQTNALCTNAENKSEQYKLPEKMEAAELKSTYLESKSQGASINTHPIELSVPKSTSCATNYYFIDASTLNDEIDIITANTAQKDTLNVSSLPSDSYVPSYDRNKSSNSVDDQSCKFTTRKATTFQTAHERVAEFQRELKLTEYLQPLTEPRKIKKLDSTSDDKNDVDKGKDKESLAVEIKEMDSGESTQPSPCPDNNTKLNNGDGNAQNTIGKDNIVKASTTVEEQAKLEDKHECPDEDTRRPLLIRRNTFELDSNDEKLSVLRQEYERRQGNLVFQNAIPQYSGHRVDGDSFFNPPTGTAVPASDDVTQYNSDIQLPVNSQHCALPSYISLEKCKHNTDQRQSNNNFLVQDTVTQPIPSYPMLKSASDKLIVQCGAESDNTNNSSSSLPVTLNSILEKELTDAVKRTKRDEAIPIISGGVSTSDYSKPTDSPTVRRKTESTPIVSGGSVIMVEPKKKTKTTRMSTSMTAWVVDMSDCNKMEQKSSTIGKSQADMSQSFSTPECVKKPTRRLSGHENHSSLGFFVNLKDMDSQQETSIKKDAQKQDHCTDKRKHNEHNKPYCEFYIDITKANTSKTCKKSERDCVNSKIEKPTESGDKKNIFSMFIDLSDPHKTLENNTKTSQKQSSSMFSDKKLGMKRDNTNNSENSSTTCDDQSLEEQKSAKERTKPGVFMFIESDSPVVRRRTLSSSRPAFKRHSWNVDKTQNSNGSSSSNGYVAKELILRKEHKRAHSLSVDRGDLKKLQAKPSSSSHSLSDAARAEPLNPKNLKTMQDAESNLANNMDTSSEDVFEFDIRDTPPNSHVEVINEELRSTVKHHDYKELTTEIPEVLEGIDSKLYEEEYSDMSAWEKTCTESIEGQTRKSETFDISSGSGPSPDSDNHEYVLSDLLNGEVPNIADRSQTVPAVASKISETHKSLNETIKKIECELKGAEHGKREPIYKNHTLVSKSGIKELQTSTEKISCNFVRLSDLDKTPVTSNVLDPSTVKEEKPTYRMSNSIPETSWIESKLVMSRANGPVRPFSRKFPSIMSTSLPSKQKSPMDDLTGECEGEGIISESDLSSMQSSMGRSGAEGSTEETETSSLAGAKPYNRLGEDLLRMFLEEINPDITIDVDGRRIRAHKCILSSRCQYFAAILSGGWIESAGNIISLQGYSYDAVHFALCHIYSGESNIPDYISIVELATLADMLCLEGLKEVIGYTLKVKYCHLFHKPCEICAIGVLACMPVAAAYGLDEVYRKSLRWITRHFVRIWPCKTFATLPKELMEKCYHQHIVYMSTDNVLQTMMDCDKLLAILPNERWAEPVFRMASNLLETSVKFLSNNFSNVLGSENFQSLGRELTWNISRLEDKFLAAAERLPPEQACKSYSKLHKMLDSTHTEESQAKLKWCSLFIDFLMKVQSRVEKCLVRDATRAAHTTMWLKMDLELRRRIQELACLVILPHETSKRQSRHSNFLKDARPSSSRSTTSRSLDLKRVKMAISEHTDKTLKQITVTQQSKKILNKPKSDPLERKMQEDKQATTDITNRPKSWPNKLEVKSRYLEPRNKSLPKETTSQVQQEKIIPQQRRKIMISSSDSSRTSSPAMKRATDKKPLAKLKLPVKKDVKALSSDSLTESTVSKGTRKDLISKSCGITRPESPSFKQKGTEIGLSVDSLAESKNKPVAVQKKANKMDTSMSTDSLMTEITTTPKSNTSNKLSPTLNKGVMKTQIYDRVKKSSPPMQQRSPLSVTRRSPRSLENSTAASRSRAAAINAYHGSPSLRRNLLDAAKTPDIPTKALNSTSRTITVRQGIQSATASANLKREKKDGTTNVQGSESPNKKLSPKLSGTSKTTKSSIASKRTASKTTDDKTRTKCHNGDTPKQPTVGSRSGTFLKDEPTVLKKADIKSSEINT